MSAWSGFRSLSSTIGPEFPEVGPSLNWSGGHKGAPYILGHVCCMGSCMLGGHICWGVCWGKCDVSHITYLTVSRWYMIVYNATDLYYYLENAG